jgi:glycosyltransferase involved in cell wall biosynthesis
VVCLDLGGPAIQVTPDTGIKIHASDPDQVIGDLTTALLRLAGDPALCRRFGQAGRQRVIEHFTWDQKGELISRTYSSFRDPVELEKCG